MKDIRHIPLDVFFNFPTPNYIDPPTRGNALVVVNAIFISFVTIAVLLRMYTRIFLKRWFGSDDVFIIFAFITTVALTVVVVLADRQYYWDRHVWDVPLQSIKGVLIIAFIAKLVFVYAATFTRLSLLCFYYRLVQDSDINWFRWAVHVSVIFNVVLCIIFTCFGIWLCQPISGYWQFPQGPNTQCMDEGPATLAIGIVNIFADLFVTLLPVPVIIRLQMPLTRRIGVMILLGLGGIVIIAGTVRTYYIWKGLMDSYDETWFTYPLWICAAVEIDLGVICACAPAIRPLTSKILASTVSSLSDKFSAIRTRREAGGPGRTPATKSYLKFSNDGEAKRGAANSNSKSSKGSISITSPGGSMRKSAYTKSDKLDSYTDTTTTTTTTTTTASSKADSTATVPPSQDSLNFITSPSNLTRTPSTEPLTHQDSHQDQIQPHPTRSPSSSISHPPPSTLRIHRRESFELSSLDYAAAGVRRPSYTYALDTIPGSPASPLDYAYNYGFTAGGPGSGPGGGSGGGHAPGHGYAAASSAGGGEEGGGIELDPRSRAGSPFGNSSHVRGRCPGQVGEREGRGESGSGSGRRKRGSGGLVGAGLGALGFV